MVDAAIGPPGAVIVVEVPAELAIALPAALTAERRGQSVVLRGRQLPPTSFENIRWSASFAVRLPGGIAVFLRSW